MLEEIQTKLNLIAKLLGGEWKSSYDDGVCLKIGETEIYWWNVHKYEIKIVKKLEENK